MNSMGEWMKEWMRAQNVIQKIRTYQTLSIWAIHLLNKEHAVKRNAISSFTVSRKHFLIFHSRLLQYFHGIVICGSVRYHGAVLTSRRLVVIHLYMPNDTHFSIIITNCVFLVRICMSILESHISFRNDHISKSHMVYWSQI